MRSVSCILFALALLVHSFLLPLENSIIPSMEKFLNLEQLPLKKWPEAQQTDIRTALARREEKIRVATYNMLFSIHDDEMAAQYRWPKRLPRILELLRHMSPDLLAVQELFPHQCEDLLPHLDDQYGCYVPDLGSGERNYIFYRKERFQLEEGRTLPLTSSRSRNKTSHTLAMAKLRDLKTGHLLTIWNTHLPFSNVNHRAMDATWIAQHLQPFAEAGPTLLCGDLNTFTPFLENEQLPALDGDYVMQLLCRGSLRDARTTALLGHLGPFSTFTNHPDQRLKTQPFSGFGTPGTFLDHILVSPQIQVLLHAVEPATKDGLFPSDHMPVVMDCLLPPQERAPAS